VIHRVFRPFLPLVIPTLDLLFQDCGVWSSASAFSLFRGRVLPISCAQ
jgi:hypothetical protein